MSDCISDAVYMAATDQMPDQTKLLPRGHPYMVRETMASARSYSSVHSILKNGLDRKTRTRATEEPAITHTNIRGADYFH